MPIRIRKIALHEGSRFREIRLRALRDSPRAFGSTVAETEARCPEYWLHRACAGSEGRESVILVAEDGLSWVGMVGGFLSEGGTRADLISMWVDPGYRGRGLGSDLVQALTSWAGQRGARSVYLGVTSDNVPAIALYERCGFLSTGEETAHPSQPDAREREMVYHVP